MMWTSRIDLVINTGPIIALEAGVSEPEMVLRRFRRVLVPGEVVRELHAGEAGASGQAILDSGSPISRLIRDNLSGRGIFTEIAAASDILAGNEEDFQLCLGVEGRGAPGAVVTDGHALSFAEDLTPADRRNAVYSGITATIPPMCFSRTAAFSGLLPLRRFSRKPRSRSKVLESPNRYAFPRRLPCLSCEETRSGLAAKGRHRCSD